MISWNNIMSQYHIDIKKMLVDHLGGHCIDCSLETNWVEVYDFHHPPGTKNGNKCISKLINEREWRCTGAFCLKLEADKCDLLCANCHRIRHAEMQDDKTRGKCNNDLNNYRMIRIKRIDDRLFLLHKIHHISLFPFYSNLIHPLVYVIFYVNPVAAVYY